MVITLFGTKGGTGTTTMAVNCAADIWRLSQRPTLVMDTKVGPGDVAVFLGLRTQYSIIELLDQMGWSTRAHAARYIAEHNSGLHVLAGSEVVGRPSARDAEGVEQALVRFTSMYDFIIVDAGSTLTDESAAVLAGSDLVLLVANPDVPCLRNLQRLTDALRLARVAPECMRVLLNRASEHGVLPVGEIERILRRPIDFLVPSDYRTVAAAVNTGVPVSCLRPTELHAQLDNMARTLIGIHRAAAAS